MTFVSLNQNGVLYTWMQDYKEYVKAGNKQWFIFEIALEFVEWVNLVAVRQWEHRWTIGSGNMKKEYTTKELFDLFLSNRQATCKFIKPIVPDIN